MNVVQSTRRSATTSSSCAGTRTTEKRLGASGLLYGQVELDESLQGVADSLARPVDREPIRLKAIKGPWPNAFVLPNGASYVTKAMLDSASGKEP